MATRPSWRGWANPGASAGLLLLSLALVASVVYLPHLRTQADIEARGVGIFTVPVEAWSGLAGAYGDLWTGKARDYDYPIHVDEIIHWVFMASLQRADSLEYPNPYTGEVRVEPPFSLRGLVHEKGFHVAFAQFQEMTGIPWLRIVQFGPAAMAVLTAWLVWVALRPWPAAPLAAALVALVPTSARFLGIGFFVPIGVSLAWMAGALVLGSYVQKDTKVGPMALLVAAWAFFIHLIGGFAVALVLLACMPAAIRGRRGNLIGLALGAIVPVLWLYNAFQTDFSAESARLGDLPNDLTIFDQLGIPFLFAWALGCAFVVLRPPPATFRVPIVAATISSAIMLGFITTNLVFGLRLYSLYDRWHQPFAVMAAIPVAYFVASVLFYAAAGLRHAARRLPAAPRSRLYRVAKPVLPIAAVVAGLVIGGAIATPGIYFHVREPYYYILTDSDWDMYEKAAKIGSPYYQFLSHPWKAPVYTALTGKIPYSFMTPGTPATRGDQYLEYLRGSKDNPVWLVEREITMVLDPIAPAVPPFHADPSGAYLLDEAYARQLWELHR